MTRQQRHIKARHEVLEQLDEVLNLRKTRKGLSHASPTKAPKNHVDQGDASRRHPPSTSAGATPVKAAVARFKRTDREAEIPDLWEIADKAAIRPCCVGWAEIPGDAQIMLA